MNSQLIIGSVAEVEQICSIAKAIRSTTLKGLIPLAFEFLLFLKVNKVYLDIFTVAEAMSTSLSSFSLQRLQIDDKHVEGNE